MDSDCAAAFGPGSVCRPDGLCEPPGPCESNAECRERVGFGSVCEMGSCVDVTPHPRCTNTQPAGLWDALDQHRDRVMFGSLAEHGETVHLARERGMDVAIDTINRAGGGFARPFGLVHCDVEGGADAPYDDGLERPDAARQLAQWLSDELGIPAIVGPMSSEDTESVFTEVVVPATPKLMLMSPSASGSSLTNLDNVMATDDSPGLLWRTAASVAAQGLTIAADLQARVPVATTKVAIVREEGSFGDGVAEPFLGEWSAAGGSAEQFAFPTADDAALVEQITKLGATIDEFAAVVVVGQVGACRTFVTTATDNDAYTPELLIYFAQGGANTDVFADATSNRLFASIRATRPVLPDGFVYQTFRDAYQMQYGEDSSMYTFTANSYDAVWLVALGSVWAFGNADTYDGLSIARGIRRLAGGSVAVPFSGSGWGVGVQQLLDGQHVDVEGASGDLDFDPATEEISAQIELIAGTADGTFVAVD